MVSQLINDAIKKKILLFFGLEPNYLLIPEGEVDKPATKPEEQFMEI